MSKKFDLLLDRVESELNTYERWLKSQTTRLYGNTKTLR